MNAAIVNLLVFQIFNVFIAPAGTSFMRTEVTMKRMVTESGKRMITEQ